MYHDYSSVNTNCTVAFCIVADMEIHERLRHAREQAGFESAADAARRFGWPETTYRHHENGIRGFKSHTASSYARAYRISPEWLLFGTGEPGKKTVPVVGYVGAGAEIYAIDDGGNLDEIEPMPGIGPEAVAVRVRGDSMFPRYFDGDTIVYDQHITLRSADGKECVVSLLDGRKFIKTVRLNGSPGHCNLESYNAPPISNVAVEWVAPVVWVKRAQ